MSPRAQLPAAQNGLRRTSQASAVREGRVGVVLHRSLMSLASPNLALLAGSLIFAAVLSVPFFTTSDPLWLPGEPPCSPSPPPFVVFTIFPFCVQGFGG